jgi:protein subunit release factor A
MGKGELLFSVKMSDCKLETFPASGAGGQLLRISGQKLKLTENGQ